MYKLENPPYSRKVTFAKIYLGDFLHYPKGIIPQECVEIKTKQINGKFHFFLSYLKYLKQFLLNVLMFSISTFSYSHKNSLSGR